ncbi:hypothetical protein CEQ90_01040 [Lewinellaceae bacterium SD302]|nr:hypothetical protein CEQ90_01040 [Lewinellaceae bacterium SD302]
MSAHQHHPRIFHQDCHGYVAYCNSCGCFQVAFGNFFVNQTYEDFTGFAELITRYLLRYRGRKKPVMRDIYLDSPYSGFGLLFSLRDLERLDDMLQKTLLLLAAGDRVRNQ